MNRLFALGAIALFVLLPSSPAFAQLLTVKDAAIVYGHHHLNATSVDEFGSVPVPNAARSARTISATASPANARV